MTTIESVRSRPARRLPTLLSPFRMDVLSTLAAFLLLIFVVVGVLGPIVHLGGSPTALSVGPRLAAPSHEFLAGTDSLGRSELPRLVRGLQTTFVLAGASVLLTATLSVALGVAAAFWQGAVGELITRGADVLFSFPALLLALLIVAITGVGPRGVVISVVLICSPLMIRVVRAAALGVVGRDFVVASKVGGARPWRIMTVQLLPNLAGTVVVQATYCLSVSMLVESGLSFLGLGVQPPNASLGSIVYEGAEYISVAPWLVFFPGGLLALVIMAVNLTGDGLRDLLDVRGSEVRR